MWPVVGRRDVCAHTSVLFLGDTYPFRKRQSSPKEELKEEEGHLPLGTSHQFLKKINKRKKRTERNQAERNPKSL